MKKRTIILSYDYELFFGERSGTVFRSIIEPSKKLMDVMERNGFRGNFFVDYLMFRELEKLSDELAQRDLLMLKDQIHDMVRRGHRIELHLHPHWIDAKYNGDGTWNFDNYTHYSLSSLDEETIVDMFKTGTAYLTTLAREVDPDYRIVAFRAGGWAVQPFDKLKRAFLESGIIIDSSTSYGLYKYMKDSYYDFRGMPGKAVFRFEDDVCKESENGHFIEVPITSFHIPALLYIREMLIRKRTNHFVSYADGTHYRKDALKQDKKPLIKRFADKFDDTNRVLINFSFISRIPIKRFLTGHSAEKMVCFIDHPKDVSPSTIDGISAIGKLCKSVNYIDLLS